MHRILLITFLTIGTLFAGDSFTDSLELVVARGGAKDIAKYCDAHVRKSLSVLKSGRIDDAALAGVVSQPSLLQACYMSKYFMAADKEKNMLVYEELKDKEFARWLVAHPAIFEEMSFAQKHQMAAMHILYRIWQDEGKQLEGTWLNLAVGLGIVSDQFDIEQCIAKYKFYKKSHASGELFAQFETAAPWEYAILLQGRETEEDMVWGQNYLAKRKKITPEAAAKVTGLIPYRPKNREGISIHEGAKFYDHKPITLPLYVEYGGVCGAVSKGACMFLRTKGVPCYLIAQPGHCSFVWRQPNGHWVLGNDIYDWVWSSDPDTKLAWQGRVGMIKTMTNFRMSSHCSHSLLATTLADYAPSLELQEKLYDYATTLAPNNFLAWQQKISTQGKKMTDEAKLETLRSAKVAMPNDPDAIWTLLKSHLLISPRALNEYKQSGFLIASDENPQSVELYLLSFSTQAKKDAPAFSQALTFDSKTQKDYLQHLSGRITTQQDLKPKDRKQLCLVFNQAIEGLVEHPKTLLEFITIYNQILERWDDKSLDLNASRYAQKVASSLKDEPIKDILKLVSIRATQ